MVQAIKQGWLTKAFSGLIVVLLVFVDASSILQTAEEQVTEIVEIELSEVVDRSVVKRRRGQPTRIGRSFPVFRQCRAFSASIPEPMVARTERANINGLGTHLLV